MRNFRVFNAGRRRMEITICDRCFSALNKSEFILCKKCKEELKKKGKEKNESKEKHEVR